MSAFAAQLIGVIKNYLLVERLRTSRILIAKSIVLEVIAKIRLFKIINNCCWFVLDLVGNPNSWFSHAKAYLMFVDLCLDSHVPSQ